MRAPRSLPAALCLAVAAACASCAQDAPAPLERVRGEPIDAAVSARAAAEPARVGRVERLVPIDSAAPAVAALERTDAPAEAAHAQPGYRALSWSVLSDFDYEMLEPSQLLALEPGAELPDLEERFPIEVLELEGRRVALEGYMIPYEYDDRGIYSFTLVRDQAQCCFGASPRMNHWVTVVMAGDGRAQPADLDPIFVRGRFSVGERVEDGYVTSIYRVSADEVEHSLIHDMRMIATEVPEASEAERVLVDLARGKCGSIPADLLARHARALEPRADWPVARAALEALLRRVASAEREELAVAARPKPGPLGLYATRRARRAQRPYRTLLARVEPLCASCDCPDFRRASLGLCKHVAAVLDDLARRPRVWERALAAEPIAPAELTWSPLRPLFGAGDWLERVRLAGDARSLARRFAQAVGGERVPRSTHADDPARRLAFVAELAKLVRERARSPRPIDPALAARIAEEQAELERVVSLGKASARLERALRGLRRPLYPYQRDGVARFLARGRLLLADDMGLGKTAQCIAAAHALFHAGLVRRGLLVVPAPLKPQWLREWALFSDVPIELVEGPPEARAATYATCARGFLVANYEQALRDLELMQRFEPELVVLDEAQRIKNWAAKTSHAIKLLRAPFRLVLTGTPLENRLDELASILDWVDDHALEPKWRLVPWHTLAGESDGARRGARHLDVLRERMAPCVLRRVRREILSQLPPRTDTLVPVALGPEQRAAHEDLKQPIASLVQRAKRRPLNQREFLRLMQLLTTQRIVCNGMAQLEFESTWPELEGRRPTPRLLASLCAPKLLELREILAQLVLAQERTVVVFSQWRRMLRLAHWAVSDLLSDNGLRGVFFTGRERQRQRTQNLVDLHDDPACRVLFSSDAGGVGLNLQRAASACIHLELPWNPAVLEQRVGRIHRLGQSEPVEAWALVAEDSIEERIATLVADKRELFQGLFDGTSDELVFEHSGGFLQHVERLYEPAPTVVAAAADDDRDPGDTSEGELERLVAAADESHDQGDEREGAGASAVPTTPADIQRLFATLAVERTASGGLRIEAPPEQAEALAALLRGLAGLLGGVAAPR